MMRSVDKFEITPITLIYFIDSETLNDLQFEYFSTEKVHNGDIKRRFYMKSYQYIQWFRYYSTCGSVTIVFKGYEKLNHMYQDLLAYECRVKLEKQRLNYGLMCLRLEGTLLEELIGLIAVATY